MDRRTFLTRSAAATALACSYSAQATPQPDDLTIVRRALALHPGLYRYQSPRAFEQRLDTLAAEWTARPALADRFLALSRLTAAVRCGHTQCNPYNQTDTVAAALFDRPTRLPFAFRWIGERMIVTGDHGAVTGIARGSIIDSIDGRNPAVLLRALLPYARADGSADAKRVRLLEMRGTERFETFDIYQGLLFPPGPDGHRIAWHEPSGARRSAALPAIGLAARQALLPKRQAAQPLWSWRIDPDGIAVLTMPDWVTYRGNWDWRGWLRERFATLAGAIGLIIDLRENEGGTDVGTFILRHLIAKPLRPVRYLNRVAFRSADADLIPYLDTWDRSFHAIGRGAIADTAGNLVIPGDEDELSIAPLAPRITVPVAVLTSPVNSSATFSFARRVKEASAAVLIGDTTGGNRRGINGGAYFFVRLPDSGLEFDVPLKGYFPQTPQPDAGILPDITVRPSIRDFVAGRDPVLARARLELLRQ